MPAFKYEALDSAGKAVKGMIEADNARAARAQLRGRQLVPMDVTLVAVAQASASAFSARVFTKSSLTVWTRQIAGLVSSGLPLERALTALGDEADDPRQRELVAHLRAEVNGGSSFAAALGTAPREFDEVYRGVVAAGEQSGALGTVLERLADDLEERQLLRAKLLGAALYPAIVSTLAMVIVTFLLTYVVPQVATVFESSKQTLPLLTRMMLGLSAFLRSKGWLLVLAALAFAAAYVAMRRNPLMRQRMDAAWLRLPIIGRLTRGYNAARFSSTLAMLAGAGVPILKALQTAAETLANHAMRADALDALVQVREGAPLASALAGKKRFPGLLAMFARLGEQTGQLPLMLERAGRQLGAEVQRRSMALATILEPLLIVIMGAVVMVIVMAVLLPIIEMNSTLK